LSCHSPVARGLDAVRPAPASLRRPLRSCHRYGLPPLRQARTTAAAARDRLPPAGTLRRGARGRGARGSVSVRACFAGAACARDAAGLRGFRHFHRATPSAISREPPAREAERARPPSIDRQDFERHCCYLCLQGKPYTIMPNNHEEGHPGRAGPFPMYHLQASASKAFCRVACPAMALHPVALLLSAGPYGCTAVLTKSPLAWAQQHPRAPSVACSPAQVLGDRVVVRRDDHLRCGAEKGKGDSNPSSQPSRASWSKCAKM